MQTGLDTGYFLFTSLVRRVAEMSGGVMKDQPLVRALPRRCISQTVL